MQNKNFFVFLNGDKPKNDSDVVDLLRECVKCLKRAQAGRKENTLGESWAADSLLELIDCIEIK